MSLSQKQAIAIALAITLKPKKKTGKKRKWVENWISKRSDLSHTNLLDELRCDAHEWRNYMRMDETTYTELLNLVTPKIRRQDTNMRKAITPHERLSATLHFLATGRSLKDIRFSVGIAACTLSSIIPETCEMIYTTLKKEYLKYPATQDDWRSIAKDFENRWNFPNCLGALDGKHVHIIPPPGSGSYFWNYKGYNSLVLMALINANYEFIMADIGTNGHVSDGGVLENTTFGKRLLNGTLCLPCSATPSSSNRLLPFVFIGDEAFALRQDFMKPYNQRDLNHAQRIFNYRLSRARQIVENVFGILVTRFRIFHTAINLKLESIEKVILACIVLHNFLRQKNPSNLFPDNAVTDDTELILDNMPSEFFAGLQGNQTSCKHSQDAKQVREEFLEFFFNEGAVHWQEQRI